MSGLGGDNYELQLRREETERLRKEMAEPSKIDFDALDAWWAGKTVLPDEVCDDVARALRLARALEMAEKALDRVNDEREWLHDVLETQTCSDICDKTYEQQGCPSGTCAREVGIIRFAKTTSEINDTIAAIREAKK